MRVVLVLTYRWVRDWPNAVQRSIGARLVYSGRAIIVSRWSRACDEFRLNGNIDVLEKAIAEEANATAGVPEARLNFEWFEVATLERDYASAARYLARIPAEAYAQEDYGIGTHQKAFHEALLAIASGSAPSRQEQALNTAEQAVQSATTPTGYYDQSRCLADLALIHALLGRKKEAIGEVLRAIDVMEHASGTIEKNAMSAALALIYARTGEAEKALDVIEHLLTVPCELHGEEIYNMTLTDLKWRWRWDPLRSNP